MGRYDDMHEGELEARIGGTGRKPIEHPAVLFALCGHASGHMVPSTYDAVAMVLARFGAHTTLAQEHMLGGPGGATSSLAGARREACAADPRTSRTSRTSALRRGSQRSPAFPLSSTADRKGPRRPICSGPSVLWHQELQ